MRRVPSYSAPLALALAFAAGAPADTVRFTFEGTIELADPSVGDAPATSLVEAGDAWSLAVVLDTEAERGLGGAFPMTDGAFAAGDLTLEAAGLPDFVDVVDDLGGADRLVAGLEDGAWEMALQLLDDGATALDGETLPTCVSLGAFETRQVALRLDLGADETWEASGAVDALTVEPIASAADCVGAPDGVIDVLDLLALLAGWGGPGACDVDGSGTIGVLDLLELLASWGACR